MHVSPLGLVIPALFWKGWMVYVRVAEPPGDVTIAVTVVQCPHNPVFSSSGH